ncbi:transposase [Azotobacter beijerinckii]|uniref:Transposase n=1 Tax=Azotobacter beijerinckii TaxID=170623 RepID=A0A1H6VE69_9GAMM|nr:transposase [Azotobacter beijerinckii]SEJ02116.1 transposase [Azotobacter beijerinckii]
MARRSFSTALKREIACLMLDQGYSERPACQAVGIGPAAVRRRVEQLRLERGGKIAERSKALTPQQPRIQGPEAQIHRIGREKEILKRPPLS